jgi:antitoxin (DNA-binding transcriptional repressor) of toxin-antitoxin stability system
MTQVTVREAQEQLIQLIALVQKGEEVLIMDGKSPLIQLTLPPSQKWMRVPGQDEGLFVIPDDFDDPLPDEILESFGV